MKITHDSEWGNWRETRGQLLDCSRIFYRISHRIESVRAPAYDNRHGGVRSTAVAEANISSLKVGGNVLEWYPHLMSEKTRKHCRPGR